MNNELVLVFGGSRGIGAACVEALAESGFDVAYTYVSSGAVFRRKASHPSQYAQNFDEIVLRDSLNT